MQAGWPCIKQACRCVLFGIHVSLMIAECEQHPTNEHILHHQTRRQQGPSTLLKITTMAAARPQSCCGDRDIADDIKVHAWHADIHTVAPGMRVFGVTPSSQYPQDNSGRCAPAPRCRNGQQLDGSCALLYCHSCLCLCPPQETCLHHHGAVMLSYQQFNMPCRIPCDEPCTMQDDVTR